MKILWYYECFKEIIIRRFQIYDWGGCYNNFSVFFDFQMSEKTYFPLPWNGTKRFIKIFKLLP